MQLSVTRRHRSRNNALTGAFVALGFGSGLAAGFLIGTLFGTGGHRRVGRIVRSASRPPSIPERRTVVLDRVRAALGTDPDFRGQHFELLAVGRSGLELRGWVDGALAIDIARAARLKDHGYRIWTQAIPADITPKNRLLLGAPLTIAI